MIRKIIQINEKKCNGCGICADACHEGAIGIVNGKAKLLRDDYCDGMGDCLPTCPTGAITFEEREAAAYGEAAVSENKKKKEQKEKAKNVKLNGLTDERIDIMQQKDEMTDNYLDTLPSPLLNWPVQIKLAPISAPYFDGSELLISADCTAYAYANFHQDFMRGKVTLIGCPKLDAVDYSKKLTSILQNNYIKSIIIVRMEVPCCMGIEIAVKNALMESGKDIPIQVVTISIEGEIIE